MISNSGWVDTKWQRWTSVWLFITALSLMAAARRISQDEYFHRYSVYSGGSGFMSAAPAIPAGILLRITQNGMDEVSSAFRKSVATALPHLTFRDLASADFLGVTVNVAELEVLSFDSFDHFRMTLQPYTDDQIGVSATVGNFALRTTITTNRRVMRAVTFTVDASNADFDIGFILSAGSSGELRVTIGSCDFEIRRIRVSTEQLDGSRLIWNFVKSLLRSNLRHFVNRKLCKVLRDHVPEEVSARIKAERKEKLFDDEINNLSFIRSIQAPKHVNGSHFNVFMQNIDKALRQLYVSSALVENPSVRMKGSNLFINFPLNGEIYAAPGPGTKVARNTIGEIEMTSNKMLYIGINEFVVNTLFNSLHISGAMNFTIDSTNTPKLEDFLQTDCDDICLGTFLPDVADAYPGETFSLSVAVDRAPVAHFNAQGIHIDVAATMTAWVDTSASKLPVLRSDIGIAGTVILRVRGHRLHGSAKVDKFSFKPRKKLNLSETATELMNEIPGKIIEMELNRVFERGIPLPASHLLSMKNAAVTPVLKGLWMELDFNFNNDALAKLIQSILSHPS